MLITIAKSLFLLLAIVALLIGYYYNDKTGAITAWEKKTFALYVEDFRYYKEKMWTFICKHVNKMIQAYEMAHQEVKR